RIERLDHIIISTRFKALHHISGISSGGQHNYWYPRFGPYLTTYFDAINPRKHKVKQNQIRFGFLETVQGLFAISSMLYSKAFRIEHNSNHFGERYVIVDNKNSRIHL